MDYNKIIGDKSAELSKEILKIIFESSDDIVINNMTMGTLTDEEKKVQEEKADKVFGAIYSVVAQSDIAFDYFDYPLVQLEAMLTFFKTRMSQICRSAKQETFDITIGHKNEKGEYEGATAPTNVVLARLNELRSQDATKTPTE